MSTRTVFIAEDSADQRILITYFFKKYFPLYSFLFFDDAQSLLARLSDPDNLANDPHPFVLLLDLNMPGFSGLQLLERLRDPFSNEYEKCRDIPVVFISGNNDPSVVARCYQAGALQFLDKPVNFEKLGMVLQSIG